MTVAVEEIPARVLAVLVEVEVGVAVLVAGNVLVVGAPVHATVTTKAMRAPLMGMGLGLRVGLDRLLDRLRLSRFPPAIDLGAPLGPPVGPQR